MHVGGGEGVKENILSTQPVGTFWRLRSRGGVGEGCARPESRELEMTDVGGQGQEAGTGGIRESTHASAPSTAPSIPPSLPPCLHPSVRPQLNTQVGFRGETEHWQERRYKVLRDSDALSLGGGEGGEW